MTKHDRVRLRAALKIHEQLTAKSNAQPIPPLPLDGWCDLVRAAERIRIAETRGWGAAATAARHGFRRLATSVSEHLSNSVRMLTADPSPPIQSLREILADLRALEQEFSEVELDLKAKTLAVETDPIVLEGVDLGRFRILLHWGELPDAGAYDVLALDPNPAAADGSTPHPHVRDEGLCEGEGRLPIRRALAAGRLFDFGLLVRQILETYNAGSAYVPLSRWHGRPCSDCGYSADDEHCTNCDCCSSDLCCDCDLSCTACGRSTCGDCRERCGDCSESFCPSCLACCSDCEASVCRSCQSDGQCGTCQPTPEESHQHEQEDDTPHDVEPPPVTSIKEPAGIAV